MAPIADFVVSLGSDGKVVKQGTAFGVLSIDPKALDEVDERDLKEPGEPERSAETNAKDASKDGKLTVAEEVEVGRVGSAACTSPVNTRIWTLRLTFVI